MADVECKVDSWLKVISYFLFHVMIANHIKYEVGNTVFTFSGIIIIK